MIDLDPVTRLVLVTILGLAVLAVSLAATSVDLVALADVAAHAWSGEPHCPELTKGGE